MNRGNNKKIVRLLGVGFDADDEHIRITKDENHDVLMGSAESHKYLQKLILKIEAELKLRDLKLEELTPDEFREFFQSIM